jgi:uncharacterized OB-fold protein
MPGDAMPTPSPRPRPVATAETRPYWDAAHAGRLVVQRCQDCGRHQFYPRAFCTACMSSALQWVEARGSGRIYSFTICRIAADPALTAPYAVALVDLDEGVRMLANLVDCDLAQIRTGARVVVRFQPLDDDLTLPQFTLLAPQP